MNFSLILEGPGKGKSTLLSWLMDNLPQQFEALQIGDHELAISPKFSAIPETTKKEEK